jgi:hypothetical protein
MMIRLLTSTALVCVLFTSATALAKRPAQKPRPSKKLDKRPFFAAAAAAAAIIALTQVTLPVTLPKATPAAERVGSISWALGFGKEAKPAVDKPATPGTLAHAFEMIRKSQK